VMVMGAVWTGGLVWSVFGGMVLVPQSAITIAGAKTATAPPPQTAAQVAQAKASTNATAKPQAQAAGASAGAHDAATHAVSHGDQVATATKGNQPLEPKLVDGVKQFELTAQVVQWEVAPGEFVEAYAYNGTVPGPLLRVTEGDAIRIVLKNELPEPTVLHLHGPRLPNSQDGVPDVTQPVI
jgi:manganese oxidase